MTFRLGYLGLRVQETKLAGLVPINTAISSNCGKVNSFKGATRDLAITRDD